MRWPWKEQNDKVSKLQVRQKQLERRIRRVEIIVAAHRVAAEAERRKRPA
jgi:hypothetical protein